MQELTTMTAGDEFDWPGIMYKGVDVFELFYGEHIDIVNARNEYITKDNQESYLGYDPDRDVFYMGFDTWLDDEDDDEWCNILCLKYNTTTDSFKAEPMESPNRMFYNDCYRIMHDSIPNLIDIRLD